MKNHIYILFVLILTGTACNDLDLNPLAEGSSETWFSNETEFQWAVNDLYRLVFWDVAPAGGDQPAEWTDDWTSRNALTPITSATINGEWSTVIQSWTNAYKAISRANTIINKLKEDNAELLEADKISFEAQARFVRASMYARLISYFGDVPFFLEELTIEDAFETPRTDKDLILQEIYADYDFAIEHLPVETGSDVKIATKGAALGLKARIALYQEDFGVAATAAKACMDLGVYTLYPDFRELFLSKTKNPNEVIFSCPRSNELGISFTGSAVQWYITRNSGGWGSRNPSWDLLAAYLCTDGLPIDESPLFDPGDPFNNRDPRLGATIVPFQSEHLGFMYQPHPDSLQVLNFKTGNYQINNDNRVNAQFASYNALVWRKWIDEDWSDDRQTDPDMFVLRFADVLLMYAEAKIELNEIDQSVLDAMNMVRARAYQVDPAEVGSYPAITTTDQAELRKTLRIERRMEFAHEDYGLRYMDLIRWRLAEKALNSTIYGMLDPADLKERIVDQGLWFWPVVPEIDEDGIPDFDPMYDAGYSKILAVRSFDASRQYLWPIPSKEILVNESLTQNPGY